jgi:phage terminase large subunit-like protein
MGKRKSNNASNALQLVREKCEASLWEFAKWINPQYIYGDIHEECFNWFGSADATDHQLLLMPRAHLKSHIIATWCCWQITRDPTTSIVYLSAGEELATDQMYAIKNMLTSDRYKVLWPEMINEEEGRREKWSAMAFNVDHPARKEHGIRDHTMIVRTVKSNAIGLHCSHLVYDDVVVPKFAYTETGRLEVQRAISQFASILNPGGVIKGVGTRYHPEDAYARMYEAVVPQFNKDTGEFDGELPQWDIKEYVVEDSPTSDGTGNYLWPRGQHPETKRWEGFDPSVWAMKRATYFANNEHSQFYAQYYNDPNDPDSHRISRDNIQYFSPKHLTCDDWGVWYYNDKKLAIFAAMDVAWTDGTKSDYTAISCIGVDIDGYIYVLELDRFKARGTEFFKYYEAIENMHLKYNFKKIRVESNGAGQIIADEIKNLIRRNGRSLTVESKAATSHDGKKKERHAAILETRFQNNSIFLRKGGLTSVFEEEVMLERPPHDDLADATAAAIEISRPPGNMMNRQKKNIKAKTHGRFGGRVW